MCEECKSSAWNSVSTISFGIACGVFWFVWGRLGFWHGVGYGLCWHEWLGYRLAEYLWR